MTIHLNPSKIHDQFAVYTLTKDDIVVWLGVCRMSQLMSTPDARRKSGFTFMTEGMCAIDILAVHDSKLAAMIDWRDRLKTCKPVLNNSGYRTGGAHTAITCVTDGKTYPNMSVAAKAYGMSPSTISNHLANRPGYAVIGGKTFKRGNAT